MNIKNFIFNLYAGFLHREPEAEAITHWTNLYNSGVDCEKISDMFLKSKEFLDIKYQRELLFVEPGHFYSPIVDTKFLKYNCVYKLTPVPYLPRIILFD